MEIIIGIALGVIIGLATGRHKKLGKKKVPYDPSIANTTRETAEQRRLRETDELITTVLPTVNRNK